MAAEHRGGISTQQKLWARDPPEAFLATRQKRMTAFKQEWTVDSAMEILRHPTVDSKLWAEAVEWLLLYGPPEIREMLRQASGHATSKSFPELQPQRYDPDGSPCYEIADLARSLGISEEEARTQLVEKEQKHGVRHGIAEADTTALQ